MTPLSDDTIPPIERSVDLSAPPRHFLERYYECRYVLDCRQPGHDYRLLFHSNGLVVVMLAPSHPLVARRATVTGIDFQVTEHTNRLDNTVSGKGKRGAQLVTAEAPLFRAICADGSRHVIPACARGKLVQLNEQLRAEPQLLVSESGGRGFVALILPKLGTSRGQLAGTLSAAEYAERRPAPVAGGVRNGDAAPAGGAEGGGGAGETGGQASVKSGDGGDAAKKEETHSTTAQGNGTSSTEPPAGVTDGSGTSPEKSSTKTAGDHSTSPGDVAPPASAGDGGGTNPGGADTLCSPAQDDR